ncbi:MAG: hypothetical protein ACK515_15520 [bacterium]|jgi:hypothetical protein|nr:hypothetical protein [Betaproteobacteria bacterium]
MLRLETRGDFSFFGVVSMLVALMGVLLLLFPTQPLPEAPDAYRPVQGVLHAFRDAGGYRGARVEFELVGDPDRYVSASPPTRESTRGWQAGRTSFGFFVLAAPTGAQDEPGRRVVHGLTIDGQELKSLRDDIAHHNSGVSPWLPVMPLALGLVGLVLSVTGWRRTRAAALPPAAPPRTRKADRRKRIGRGRR